MNSPGGHRPSDCSKRCNEHFNYLWHIRKKSGKAVPIEARPGSGAQRAGRDAGNNGRLEPPEALAPFMGRAQGLLFRFYLFLFQVIAFLLMQASLFPGSMCVVGSGLVSQA